jgi:N-acetylglucosaminyldiphosphoundecaprenol N-acetyl-beta-D-mannosaminyltransferase
MGVGRISRFQGRGHGLSASSFKILGVRVDDVTFSEMLAAVARFVQIGGAHQISTVNIEYLMTARRDAEFAEVLRRTALNVPDSVGVLWAARWLGHPLRERVTGSDGMYRVAELCAQRGFRLFLLGAAPGTADRVASILLERYPGLDVCGTLAGSPFPEHEASISAAIRKSRADVLLVAYPHAPQEKWIARSLPQTGAAVGMGVGGAFDFCAGVQQRAPLWMQRGGVEWLYRLARQPWRWRRMLALPQAAWLVFWERFKPRTNSVTRDSSLRSE